MTHRDSPWPDGAPCWVDAQLDDPAAAREFYTSLLGWQWEDGPAGSGSYHRATVGGRPVAGLGPKPGGWDERPSSWTTYFACADLDASCARAQEVGGYLSVPPFDAFDAGRMALGVDAVGAPFAWWQPGSHPGFTTYGEPGSVCWSELHTADYQNGQQFYRDLFGWTFTEMGDGDAFVYSAFTVPGLENSSGGVFLDPDVGDRVLPHWLVWFEVADCDAAAGTVARLGGVVLEPPQDSSTGRMSVVTGPQGELFAMIDTHRTVGTHPLRDATA